jgi:hypothetical protein
MCATERQVVYKSHAGAVYWDEDTQCVELEILSEISSEDYRDFLERALLLLGEKGAHKLLGDATKMAGRFGIGDMLWAETDWWPRCLKVGLTAFAMAVPKALDLHLSVDKFAEKFDPESSGYIRKFFTDIDEAREWLRQQ